VQMERLRLLLTGYGQITILTLLLPTESWYSRLMMADVEQNMVEKDMTIESIYNYLKNNN